MGDTHILGKGPENEATSEHRITRLEHVLGRLEGKPSQPPASADRQPTPAKPAAPAPQKGSGANAKPVAAERTPAEADDTRFRRVYELVDAGASPIKAAEQLGLPLGEVELILNLRDLR